MKFKSLTLIIFFLFITTNTAFAQNEKEKKTTNDELYKAAFMQKDMKKAHDQLLELSKKDFAQADYTLGDWYFFGNGCEKDINKADEHYKKAFAKFNSEASSGNSKSEAFVAKCYYEGKGVKQNYKEAAKIFKEMATDDNAVGLCGYGKCLYYGKGIKKNKKEAIKLFEKSAALGCAEAHYMLAVNCGDDKDKAIKRFEHLKKAGELYHAEALFELGLCYFNGNGCEENGEKVFESWEHSSRLGCAQAQYFLGFVWYQGRDEDKQIYWLKKSAENGYAASITALKTLADYGCEKAKTALGEL